TVPRHPAGRWARPGPLRRPMSRLCSRRRPRYARATRPDARRGTQRGRREPAVRGRRRLAPRLFHQGALAVALDHLRLAFGQVAALAPARIAHLMAPASTGLRPHLGNDSADSGALILEYVAQGALVDLVHAADPATRATVVIGGGQDDHASFA